MDIFTGDDVVPSREHERILKQGARAWNRWRRGNPSIEVDLQDFGLSNTGGEHFDLKGADLSGVDLRRAQFIKCDLSGSCFNGAKLGSAKFEFCRLDGASFRNAGVHETEFSLSDMKSTDFRELDSDPFPSSADFSNSDLSGAKFDAGNFVNTNFHRATLNKASFKQARLSGCEFIYINEMIDADFSDSSLDDSDLRYSNWTGAIFERTDMTNIAVSPGADLFKANWTQLIIADETYERQKVKDGECVLPFGMGNPLRFVFHCGLKDATSLSTLQALVERFNSESETTQVLFTVGPKGGSEFSVRSFGATEDTMKLGANLAAITERLKTLEDGQVEILSQGDQQIELAYREQRFQSELLAILGSLELTKIETQTEKEAAKVKQALAKNDLLNKDVSVKGRVIRFTKAIWSSPLLAATLLGVLGETLASGSFSLVAGGAAALLDVSNRAQNPGNDA